MNSKKEHRPNPPDIGLLQMFEAVHHNGSFQSAGKQMKVSTSAVSQAMQRLELQVGQALIDRTQRPLALTHFGHRYLPLASQLISAARTYQTACHELSRARREETRIGCVDSFAATVGSELVKSFAGQSGNVIMHSGITPEIVQQLMRHELHFAICTNPCADNPNIHAQVICQENWVVVSPEPQGWPASMNTESLAEHAQSLPVIRYSQRSVIGSQIDRFLAHLGHHLERRFEFDGTDALLSLVSSGVGWAITSPLCLLQSLHNAQKVTISELPLNTQGFRTFYLLCQKGPDEAQANRLAQITKQILQHKIRPRLAQALPALNRQCLVVAP
jgi:DNA-binding transcriptional LysR family regulator